MPLLENLRPKVFSTQSHAWAAVFQAAGGDFTLEVVELGGFESTRVALVVLGKKPRQSAAVVQLQPVADGA